MSRTAYFTGLDLGQAADYSAIVVVEQTSHPDGTPHRYGVRHLHRWQLGTGYPAIVADLGELFATGPLRNSTLIVDATGVGRPVVDMIISARLPAVVRAYAITAGMTPNEQVEPGKTCTVPKRDLVGSVQSALQGRRLEIAAGLDLAAVLAKEMETFRVRVTEDRNETFASWRERDHDDILLAMALAVWYGERHPGNLGDCYSKPKPRTPGIDPITGLPAHIFGPDRDPFRTWGPTT